MHHVGFLSNSQRLPYELKYVEYGCTGSTNKLLKQLTLGNKSMPLLLFGVICVLVISCPGGVQHVAAPQDQGKLHPEASKATVVLPMARQSSTTHRCVRKALQPGGLFTRAFFDALDTDNNGTLCSDDIQVGLRDLLKHDDETFDCVVLALAEKIGHEISRKEFITLRRVQTTCGRGKPGPARIGCRRRCLGVARLVVLQTFLIV